ncbi:MAG: hypothetical protein FJ134_02575 [Deltaproteobacteria bacterium]|nr:hypothetical protein [Deltaproteobacteria bacterium]
MENHSEDMINSSKQKNLFGFLRYEYTIEFDGGTVTLLPFYKESEAWVDEYLHEDGFLYPPLVSKYRCDPVTLKPIEKIPKTQRPANLHRIPPSHELILTGKKEDDDLRKESGAFIIYLLSYLFGTRLQFYDWWFDKRVPIEKTHAISFQNETVEDFLSYSILNWKSWNDNERKSFINLLYMHSRSPSYDWEWESFVIEYMVFDGLFSLAESLGIFNSRKRIIRHKDRITLICNIFEIPINDTFVDQIIRLRNELIHNAIWDGGMPCSSGSHEAHLRVINLRRLNQRLIPAILQYKTPYIRTGWWYLGQCIFEPRDRSAD